MEWVAIVDIDGDAVSVYFPVGGNGYGAPVGGIEIGLVKIFGALFGIGCPVKFPIAIKGKIEWGIRKVTLFKTFQIGIGDEVRTRSSLADVEDGGIFPIGIDVFVGIFQDIDSVEYGNKGKCFRLNTFTKL